MSEPEESGAEPKDAEVKPGVGFGEAIKAGGSVPTSNSRHDALTIYIDALQGLMVSPEGVKVSFVEHFVEEREVHGRYVLNLMMTFQQMKAIGRLFSETAEKAEVEFKKLAETNAVA